MKIQSYKEYKSNGFSLKYYTRIINDYGVQRTVVIAYCDGRRMKDFSGEEKYALRSIICRLAGEQRAAETEKYIKEQAARMGVSEYVIKAHIEEVERKNMKATAQENWEKALTGGIDQSSLIRFDSIRFDSIRFGWSYPIYT